jgi:hypothetical protein
VSGACKLVWQLGCGSGRGRELCLRDVRGRRDKRVEAGTPSSGTGIDELFGHTVLSSVDVDDGGRWESGEIFRFFFYFSRISLALVQCRTWLALSLIKCGEEIGPVLGSSRSSLIMSDDEYGGGGGGGDYDYGGPRYVSNPRLQSESTSLKHTSASQRILLFVTRTHFPHIHQIDPLRKKRMTDTTSWPKTTKRVNKPV